MLSAVVGGLFTVRVPCHAVGEATLAQAISATSVWLSARERVRQMRRARPCEPSGGAPGVTV